MKNRENYKIAAVVVTFNRLELLKLCLESLRKQTKKVDEIIVVNNSSSDGTLEWLNTQTDLTIITQDNSGSAGGQHTGMKAAYEKGFDWIWSMDDDIYAAKDCLENLFKFIDENKVLNSLPVTADKKLSYRIFNAKNFRIYKDINEIKDFEFFDGFTFFNATLFSRKIIKEVGFPNPTLFIRGDENDFYFRILKKNFEVIVVSQAVVIHKKVDLIEKKIFKYEHSLELMDKVKRYYHTRNMIYNYKRHYFCEAKTIFRILSFDFYMILIYQRKIEVILYFLKAVISGLKLHSAVNKKI